MEEKRWQSALWLETKPHFKIHKVVLEVVTVTRYLGGREEFPF